MSAENETPQSKLGFEKLASQNQPKDPEIAQRMKVLDALKSYLMESRQNAKEWQDKAQKSWDMLHGRIDWSHKTGDQSKVHINRVGLAQEQIKAQIKAGLMNFDQWIVVEPEIGFDPETSLFSLSNAKRMVLRGIEDNNPKAQLSDNIGISLVENMLATKLKPCVYYRRGPGGKEIKEFYIEHIPLNIRSYYPDAKMSGLYEFHEVEMDHYKVMELSADTPSDVYPFNKELVKNLKGTSLRIEETNEQRDRGNDTTITTIDRRKSHVLHEFWGTVLDVNGEIMKWKFKDGKEIELRNVIIVMANESEIISNPRPFPCWDGTSDIISMQVLRSNINTYGKSLLAPGVDMNKAEDELINACIDAGLKESYNVNSLKLHGLAEKKQASGGIKYGTTLLQNNQLAPGEKLIETVKTGQVSGGALQILQIVQAAGSENMRLNEVKLSGKLQNKQTRATEVVAANETIQGLFESIIGDIEDVYVEKYAKKVFYLMLQNAKLLNDMDLEYIFYGNKEKIEKFKSMSPKELFNAYAYCFRFRGKGIRSVGQSAKQAQMLVQLLNMIVANPLMNDSFERQGWDVTKMMEDIIRNQGLDAERYISQDVAQFAQQRQLIREEALANAEIEGQNQQQPGAVNAPVPSEGTEGAVEGNDAGY